MFKLKSFQFVFIYFFLILSTSHVFADVTLSIGIIGTGTVGKAFINQLAEQKEQLKQNLGINLLVNGIANSKKMVLENDGIDLKNWNISLSKSEQLVDLNIFTAALKTGNAIPIIIDCTAGKDILLRYIEWLNHGVSVITPNKIANSSSLNFYKDLRHAAKTGHSQFLYGANVGAGLPIIDTLKNLIMTGDHIEKIEGIFSGTLSFLFNNFKTDILFSNLVKIAQEKGYTEPDPKEDLSGLDVKRKLLILSREMGDQVELSDVIVQDLSQFNDHYFKDMLKDAEAKDNVLRYVGVIQPGEKIKVELRSYPKTHPFASTTGTENIVLFQTKRYNSQNLIIRGPGAGAEVTASGIFINLLEIARHFELKQ